MRPDALELDRRLDLIARAFSPSSPITTKDLFAGRVSQLNRLLDVTAQRGQHALVYGDRGVGKTSLAKVVHAGSESTGCICAYYTCSSGDTFGDIWARTLEEIRWVVEAHAPGFRDHVTKTVDTAARALPPDPSPHDVRRVLQSLAAVAEVIIFIDEFDRPTDIATRNLFADTIKILADNGVRATLVLIGVAQAVGDLVAEHESIGRSLIQVQMPLMDHDELAKIITNGMAAAHMQVDAGFIEKTVEISQGLPHYTHLIAQHGARHAAEMGRDTVHDTDLREAVNLALEDVSQTVRETYYRATSSGRRTIYEEVLLACALAERDDLGEFGSADLRQPLRDITGKPYEIPAYSSHLNAFADESGPRGGILRRGGTDARARWRFIDPLMPPYVVMQGHARGLIKQ